jgi:hypothetical protein
VAGLIAVLADTVEAIHLLGVVHGRITPDHVVLDAQGYPVLIGFADASLDGDRDKRHERPDDAAGLGHLLLRLLGGLPADGLTDRGRRTNRRRVAALTALANDAVVADRWARPSAHRISAAILEAVPSARPHDGSGAAPAGPLDQPTPPSTAPLPTPTSAAPPTLTFTGPPSTAVNGGQPGAAAAGDTVWPYDAPASTPAWAPVPVAPVTPAVPGPAGPVPSPPGPPRDQHPQGARPGADLPTRSAGLIQGPPGPPGGATPNVTGQSAALAPAGPDDLTAWSAPPTRPLPAALPDPTGPSTVPVPPPGPTGDLGPHPTGVFSPDTVQLAAPVRPARPPVDDLDIAAPAPDGTRGRALVIAAIALFIVLAGVAGFALSRSGDPTPAPVTTLVATTIGPTTATATTVRPSTTAAPTTQATTTAPAPTIPQRLTTIDTSGIVAHNGHKYRITRPGTTTPVGEATVGDFRCDGTEIAIALDPGTGDMWVFDGWSESGTSLDARQVTKLAPGSHLAPAPIDERNCASLTVRLPDGSRTGVVLPPPSAPETTPVRAASLQTTGARS